MADCEKERIALFIEKFTDEDLINNWRKFRNLIDAASGGALVNKTLTEAKRLISTIAANTQQFGIRQDATVRKVNEETKASIHNLENQVSQLATVVGRLETQNSGRLPSQIVVNPEQDANFTKNINAITLRSGKELKDPEKKIPKYAKEKEIECEIEPKEAQKLSPPAEKYMPPSVVTPPPFPSRLAKNKKEQQEQEILEVFCKVEVNIPLLDAIKQVPRYAKFLKELCTSKRKLKGDEKVHKAMIDLEASINVMPSSIYHSLNVGPLKPTGVIIQLANRSNAYPEGVLEDVLVQVNELIFPADFYVFDMEDDNSSKLVPILLGRPFLKTSRTKIDILEGTLTMEFDGEVIRFNIYEAMRFPSDVNSVFVVDVIDSLAQQIFELQDSDNLKVVLNKGLNTRTLQRIQ
ncbi:uncharacterized protein LOC123196623 [Mangifera indica]|uniref:uncharacterized protein LOC123196623 n=1 Tax=Mangifera indica TaxID=29780 RepID=UPI001CFA7125|nr:uncharacterized protein LOC123196623 [Mangifera indica]